MRIQKRYIYSSFLAGLFFAIFYVFVDINIFISLLITFVIFLTGILIFKEKDVRVYDPNKEFDYCYQTSKLLNYSNYINDEKIKKLIKSISSSSESILNLIDSNKNKITQIYNFYDYYLDLALKMVTKYMTVRDKDKEFASKVDDYLENIDDAYKKLLNSLKQNNSIDVDREIKMFERKLNITDNDIKGSD